MKFMLLISGDEAWMDRLSEDEQATHMRRCSGPRRRRAWATKSPALVAGESLELRPVIDM